MRVCLFCAESLDGRRPEARFCSDAHRVAWHRANPAPDGVDRFFAAAAKIRRRRPARRTGAPVA